MAKKSDPNIGKAFRSRNDGRVRWIVRLSKNKNYELLWLDESGVWHQSGYAPTKTFDRFYGGEEAPAPQPGETYKMANTFSGFRECIA